MSNLPVPSLLPAIEYWIRTVFKKLPFKIMNLSYWQFSAPFFHLVEQKETIDPALLQQISAALKIPAEAIQNFDEDSAINIISKTVNNNDNANGNSLFSYYPTINPIEKLVQLHEEKIALYERMLKEKDEMIVRLEKLVEKSKRIMEFLKL